MKEKVSNCIRGGKNGTESVVLMISCFQPVVSHPTMGFWQLLSM
jgi:hypothetical protein